jgi:uncharacterized protein YcfJ
MKIKYLVLAIALSAVEANAGSTLDAAIGGGLGGAVGAAIGNEVGGRDGSIIGGAIGGAVGTAINTDEHSDHHASKKIVYIESTKHQGYHCPPGQAKKGRC